MGCLALIPGCQDVMSSSDETLWFTDSLPPDYLKSLSKAHKIRKVWQVRGKERGIHIYCQPTESGTVLSSVASTVGWWYNFLNIKSVMSQCCFLLALHRKVHRGSSPWIIWSLTSQRVITLEKWSHDLAPTLLTERSSPHDWISHSLI